MTTRLASQALGRFRGNAHAIFQDRLAGRVGVLEDGRIDVHHDLIALARRTRINTVMERRLGEQRERVRLLVLERRLLLLQCTPSVRHGN